VSGSVPINPEWVSEIIKKYFNFGYYKNQVIPSCIFLSKSALSTKAKGFPVNRKTSRAYAISSGAIKEIDVPDMPALATRPKN